MQHLSKFFHLVLMLLFTINGFSNRLDPVANNNQLYLTTNKEMYSPSETICFQAFLVNTRTAISTSIFVELYDCLGNKILSKKLPLENNLASGSFILPGIANDYYLLYCYTLGNNGKSEFDFIKKVAIRESAIVASDVVNKNFTATDLNVEYYFEGGNFVNELSNNVLIKTSTNDHQPISVLGKIINEKNEVVSIFNTNEQGFINVNVIPFKNEKCSLVIKDNAGGIKTVPMPVASKEGLSFRMITFEKSIYYIVQLLAQSYNSILNYTLEILQDDQILYQSDLKFNDGKSQLHEEIDNSILPKGYLRFRIRDSNKKIYTDRLYYNTGNVSPSNTIQIIDSFNHKTYSVALPDYVNGSGCISINTLEKDKSSLLQHVDQSLAKTLGTPELNKDINFSKYNDYLISVKSISEQDKNNSPELNNLLTLGGTLYSAENKIIKNKKVNVIIKENKNSNHFYETSTDKNGRLQIDNLLFFDTVTVYYQLADKSEGKNLIKLVLDKIPNVYLTEGKEKIKDFLCVKKDEVINNNIAIAKASTDTAQKSKMLKEVIVNSKLTPVKTDRQLFEEKYISPKFSFVAARDEFDFITNPKEEIYYESVLDFIKGRIPSIRVDKGGIYNPSVRNVFTNEAARVDVYIDETLIEKEYDQSDLAVLWINDIALIRFYGTNWRPNPGGEFGGTLVIYTKKGDEHHDKPTIGLPKVKITGYDSDISQVDETHQPADYKTIFWKPNYAFDGNKIIYATFVSDTNDKTIEIKIEGINNDKIPFTFIKNISTK